MNTNNKSNSTSGGIGTVGALTLIFIVLKLVGVINWSWLLVLSPIWIVIGLYVLVVIVAVILAKRNNRRKAKK